MPRWTDFERLPKFFDLIVLGRPGLRLILTTFLERSIDRDMDDSPAFGLEKVLFSSSLCKFSVELRIILLYSSFICFSRRTIYCSRLFLGPLRPFFDKSAVKSNCLFRSSFCYLSKFILRSISDSLYFISYCKLL